MPVLDICGLDCPGPFQPCLGALDGPHALRDHAMEELGKVEVYIGLVPGFGVCGFARFLAGHRGGTVEMRYCAKMVRCRSGQRQHRASLGGTGRHRQKSRMAANLET